MEVHKIEIMVIDFDNVGADGIKSVIENAHYPNRCISPTIKSIETRAVYWSDDHPLNFRSTCDQAYKDLFK